MLGPSSQQVLSFPRPQLETLKLKVLVSINRTISNQGMQLLENMSDDDGTYD